MAPWTASELGVRHDVRRPIDRGANLQGVTEVLIELRARLQHVVSQLRSGQTAPDATLALIEDCARLANEAAAQVDASARAALEPLPDLPGQLPLPAA